MPHVCELGSGALIAVVGQCPQNATTFRGAGMNVFVL